MRISNVCCLLALALLDCWFVLASGSQPPTQEEVAEVEESLRSLFGFRNRPNIDRTKVVIPQEMLQLYERQTGLKLKTASIPKRGYHLSTANTVRSFTHVENPVDARFTNPRKIRLKFDLSTVPKGETLKAAELTLRRSRTESDHPLTVIVEHIVRPGVKGKSPAIKRLVDSKKVTAGDNSTVKLDVTEAVLRWMEAPSDNHGLVVSVYGKKSNVRLKRDVGEPEEEWTGGQPLLFTYTDDGKNKPANLKEMVRTRRSPRAVRKRNRNTCSRQKMYVDFTDVGWSDWIVAPPGYDAFFCDGECNFPLADHLNTTNHAIVQTLMNSVNPSVPRACCVPTQLNSISMLYLDDEKKVVLKNYKEMVVIGCGCR